MLVDAGLSKAESRAAPRQAAVGRGDLGRGRSTRSWSRTITATTAVTRARSAGRSMRPPGTARRCATRGDARARRRARSASARCGSMPVLLPHDADRDRRLRGRRRQLARRHPHRLRARRARGGAGLRRLRRAGARVQPRRDHAALRPVSAVAQAARRRAARPPVERSGGVAAQDDAAGGAAAEAGDRGAPVAGQQSRAAGQVARSTACSAAAGACSSPPAERSPIFTIESGRVRKEPSRNEQLSFTFPGTATTSCNDRSLLTQRAARAMERSATVSTSGSTSSWRPARRWKRRARCPRGRRRACARRRTAS